MHHNPYDLVAEDQPAAICRRGCLRRLGATFYLQFVNACLRRRVLDAEEAEHRAKSGKRSGNIEAPTPPEAKGEQERTHAERQKRAYRMRRIPDGHLGRQLLRMNPMRKHLRARRKAHALRPAVQYPQRGKHRGKRGATK